MTLAKLFVLTIAALHMPMIICEDKWHAAGQVKSDCETRDALTDLVQVYYKKTNLIKNDFTTADLKTSCSIKNPIDNHVVVRIDYGGNGAGYMDSSFIEKEGKLFEYKFDVMHNGTFYEIYIHIDAVVTGEDSKQVQKSLLSTAGFNKPRE